MRQARNNPDAGRRKLTAKNIASLDALGFNRSVRASEKSFERRIEDLQVYKERHGHTTVKRSEDKSLYDFCSHMRQARNNPAKSPV